MLNGAIRGQINKLRDALWSGGVSNPLTGVEQLTYLLFIRRLDEIQSREEAKAQALGRPVARSIFPEGKDGLETPGFRDGGCPYELMRWSRFKNEKPERMFEIVDSHVFPFVRTLGGAESIMAAHMKGARLAFTRPALLDKLVEGLDEIPMDGRDTKGDVYEYLLSMIATAGENGQFRTPRHIIDLMVQMMAPKPTDTICDPAAGTAGFLMMAAEYLRETHPEIFRDARLRDHFETKAFTGFDFDETMLRIGAMNLMLHGIEEPRITYRDSLTDEGDRDAGQYTLILANPPFSGSIDKHSTSKRLTRVVQTGKTELLFIARFIDMLKTGGRAAIIVPNGVLEAEQVATKKLRKTLVEENTLEAIISLPHWVFKPYASVATSIVIFTKGGRTEKVGLFGIGNDGFLDDAQKTPVEGSELPEALSYYRMLKTGKIPPDIEGKRKVIDLARIRGEDYDLCPRYYLLEHAFPDNVPTVAIGDLFEIVSGRAPASSANGGDYPFATSAREIRSIDEWAFEGEAICIPTVSATGHGHAAINSVHYMSGKFNAATITAVLIPKTSDVDVKYVHSVLSSFKDEILVSLMRGATNVTLNLDRLRALRIPMPDDEVRGEVMTGIKEAERAIDDARLQFATAKSRLLAERAKFKSFMLG